jgi:hypothetical protein
MCPDKQLLSVYYDGELPSPWKEKMGIHLASCADCRTVMAAYRKLSLVLKEDLSPVLAKRCVSFLQARKAPAAPQAKRKSSLMRRTITRRVAVPLPFAAIAAAALIFAFASLFLRAGAYRAPEAAAVAEGIDFMPEEIYEAGSMDDALRFIESEEFFAGPQSGYVIMRLPENKTFYNFGAPQIQYASGNASGNPVKGAPGR